VQEISRNMPPTYIDDEPFVLENLLRLFMNCVIGTCPSARLSQQWRSDLRRAHCLTN